MSHIQKILERAEREGAIRPSNVSIAPEADRRAAAPPPAEAVFPIVPVDVAPVSETLSARVVSARIHPGILEALRPGSISFEQYRSLRTRLLQVAHGRSTTALVVTSSTRGEGRTHMAASLALSMTQESDRRVCVVDANLRDGQVRSVFGLPDGPGLGDVLAERAPLEQALIQLEGHNVTLLPAGDPSTDHELLGSTAMRRVMQALRTQFDRIVIDAPPAIPVADVALLTPLVDALMLVIRASVTPKPTIHEAIRNINSDKLLGVVLNDAR